MHMDPRDFTTFLVIRYSLTVLIPLYLIYGKFIRKKFHGLKIIYLNTTYRIQYNTPTYIGCSFLGQGVVGGGGSG
jgi:hypothetical protein